MAEGLEGLGTPCGVVDLGRMEANLERMQAYADEHGLGLRPHTKTHKAAWLGARQVELGAAGLTVATPVEAELMAKHTPELLVAHPPLGRRADMVARLSTRTRVLVGLDSVEAVQALRDALERHGGGEVGVLVELDMGMRRTGVPDAAAAVEVARACGDGVVYRGVMFYPGHVREPTGDQDPKLDSLAVELSEAIHGLADAGLEAEIVSGGSTPTAFRSHEMPMQTEIRPGTYIFNDRTTAAIGACAWDDCAYTVLATVVSAAVPGHAVIDAGSKALSSDPIRAPDHGGYGQLLDQPDVTVTRLSEEHGVLDLSRTSWRPRVGERVRVIPNHVCVSVNLQPVIHGIRDGAVERSWEVEAKGWG